MKFPKSTIVVDVSLEAKGANPKPVTITILEGDVPDDVVIASALAGNSPRVRAQAQIRRDGFPPGFALEMTAAEWFGAPRARVVQTRPMTKEEMVANMDNDPAFAEHIRKLLAQREQ